MRYCGKIFWARWATDDNMVHMHCMLDTTSSKHALRICNTYRFSSATTVAGKHLVLCTLPVLLVLFSFILLLNSRPFCPHSAPI